MADRADVLLGGLKRLQRELDYYKDELDKLHKRMDTSKVILLCIPGYLIHL